jgi:DNA-binding XRE family transcriptional regulator
MLEVMAKTSAEELKSLVAELCAQATPEALARLEAERAELEAFRGLPIVRHPLDQWLYARGISREKAARMFKVTPQTLTNIFSGRHRPSPATAKRIAHALGIPARKLFPR